MISQAVDKSSDIAKKKAQIDAIKNIKSGNFSKNNPMAQWLYESLYYSHIINMQITNLILNLDSNSDSD